MEVRGALSKGFVEALARVAQFSRGALMSEPKPAAQVAASSAARAKRAASAAARAERAAQVAALAAARAEREAITAA